MFASGLRTKPLDEIKEIPEFLVNMVLIRL
jgi:hypothetical protein